MIAQENAVMTSAAESIYLSNEDYNIRKIARERADFLREQTYIAKRTKEFEQQIASKDAEIANKDTEIANQKAEITNKDTEIAGQKAEIAGQKAEIANQKAEIERLRAELANRK